MSVSIKTVKDINTHSGSVDQTVVPYKAYMRISCIEMEKARRMTERKQAVERIKQIDKRLSEIEGEKQGLQNRLTQAQEPLQSHGPSPKGNKANLPRAGEGVRQDDSFVAEGFKIKY